MYEISKQVLRYLYFAGGERTMLEIRKNVQENNYWMVQYAVKKLNRNHYISVKQSIALAPVRECESRGKFKQRKYRRYNVYFLSPSRRKAISNLIEEGRI